MFKAWNYWIFIQIHGSRFCSVQKASTGTGNPIRNQTERAERLQPCVSSRWLAALSSYIYCPRLPLARSLMVRGALTHRQTDVSTSV